MVSTAACGARLPLDQRHAPSGDSSARGHQALAGTKLHSLPSAEDVPLDFVPPLWPGTLHLWLRLLRCRFSSRCTAAGGRVLSTAMGNHAPGAHAVKETSQLPSSRHALDRQRLRESADRAYVVSAQGVGQRSDAANQSWGSEQDSLCHQTGLHWGRFVQHRLPASLPARSSPTLQYANDTASRDDITRLDLPYVVARAIEHARLRPRRGPCRCESGRSAIVAGPRCCDERDGTLETYRSTVLQPIATIVLPANSSTSRSVLQRDARRNILEARTPCLLNSRSVAGVGYRSPMADFPTLPDDSITVPALVSLPGPDCG